MPPNQVSSGIAYPSACAVSGKGNGAGQVARSGIGKVRIKIRERSLASSDGGSTSQ